MLLFAESFDGFATGYAQPDITKKWASLYAGNASYGLNIGAYGRRSTKGLRLQAHPNAGNSGNMVKGLAPTGNTAIVGVAFKTAGTNTAFYFRESPIVMAIMKSGVLQCSLRLQPHTGNFDLIRGTGGSVVSLRSTDSGLVAGAFNSVEWKVTIAPGTGGSSEVRINGVTVLSITGINTANQGAASYDGVLLGGAFSVPGSGGGNLDMDYDDLYVCDGSGAAPCNDFLGDIKVDALFGTTPGTKSEWLSSAGFNHQAVDEVPSNDDIDFVAGTAPPMTDTYPFAGGVAAGGVVYGVQSCITVRKTDAGACDVAAVARVAGVEYVGPTIIPTLNYAAVLTMFQINPATGLPWTDAEFNAAEFGYKRV